jgi:hypothetical protein
MQTWSGGSKVDLWKWLGSDGGIGDFVSSSHGHRASFSPPESSPRELRTVLLLMKEEVDSFIGTYNNTGSRAASDVGFSELYDPLAALKRQLDSLYRTYTVIAPRTSAM